MRKLSLVALLLTFAMPILAQTKQSLSVKAISNEVSGRTVRQKVLTDTGITYTIMCSMTFRWDKCSKLIEGERFTMEIDKKTAWINGLKNGNQGKRIRIKFDIVDVR